MEEAENRRRNELLRTEIDRLNLASVEVKGSSPDLSHQEPSFAVAAQAEAGLKLARAFEQLAIYHVLGDELSLMYCDSERQIRLGSFRERLRYS